MSLNDTAQTAFTDNVEVLYLCDSESSDEPATEEWSSLKLELPEDNVKRLLYDQDIYNPGNDEICTKYLSLSASSVLRHPYYKYPGVTDPGIKEALLVPEPRILYSDDGQELYLVLCKEMGVCPIRSFHKQLLDDIINLRYYGIHPMSFRPIAMSLKSNRFVKVLDLTDNWISADGCYHLGEMLVENIILQELVLHGCRIGPEGARFLFANIHVNRTLRKINLTKNCLTDVGVEYLSKAILLGCDLTNINLCYNNLTAKSLLALTDSFETNNKLTHLDLSWNTILSPNAILNLCNKLSENMDFEEINLSWNSLCGVRVGNGVKNLMKNSNIKSLYLSNNKLSTAEINQIKIGLSASKTLTLLDLSYNPLTSKDALNILLCLKDRKIKLKNLLLENVLVTTEFLQLKDEILELKYRKNMVITWGYVKTDFMPTNGDMREIVLNRAEFLCKQSKKSRVDIALVILEINKVNKEPIGLKEFTREIKRNGANLGEDLIEEIVNSFPGPGTGNAKTVNLSSLVDYLQRKWPDKKLPPTPPPEVQEVTNLKIEKKKKKKKKT